LYCFVLFAIFLISCTVCRCIIPSLHSPGLMRASPSLTARALAMHNAVLRKAAHDNAGVVIEQEGDSWAIAFHEPSDAVAFCMQAQQALHKVVLGNLSSRVQEG
jgi:class 3 adenylate cyclase